MNNKKCPFCKETSIEILHELIPVADMSKKVFKIGCLNRKCEIQPVSKAVFNTEQEALNAWGEHLSTVLF